MNSYGLTRPYTRLRGPVNFTYTVGITLEVSSEMNNVIGQDGYMCLSLIGHSLSVFFHRVGTLPLPHGPITVYIHFGSLIKMLSSEQGSETGNLSFTESSM